jgi:hypothetical protein
MFRALTAAAVLLSFAGPSFSQKVDEEKAFLRSRWIKILMNPDTKLDAFKKAIGDLIQSAGGYSPLVVENVELFLKVARSRKEEPFRWNAFTNAIVIISHCCQASKFPKNKDFLPVAEKMKKLVTDDVVKQSIEYLKDRKNAEWAISFLTCIPERAAAAIPELEKIRDEPNDRLALMALNALKVIQKKKQ